MVVSGWSINYVLHHFWTVPNYFSYLKLFILKQRFYNLYIDKHETITDESLVKMSIKVSKNKDGDPIINGQLKVLEDIDNLVVCRICWNYLEVMILRLSFCSVPFHSLFSGERKIWAILCQHVSGSLSIYEEASRAANCQSYFSWYWEIHQSSIWMSNKEGNLGSWKVLYRKGFLEQQFSSRVNTIWKTWSSQRIWCLQCYPKRASNRKCRFTGSSMIRKFNWCTQSGLLFH